MLKKLEFKQYNFRIVDFNSIFIKKIEVDLINDLHRFELFKSRITSHAKKFFYHHIIFGLCEFLLHEKAKEKTIIYFNNTQMSDLELFKYFKEDEVRDVVEQIIRRIKILLPIRVFITNISYDFLQHLIDRKDGRGVEVINSLKAYMDSVNHEKYTFSRVLTFTKRNDLVFLSKEYFDKLRAKQLIIV
jgi:hypothetical protein